MKTWIEFPEETRFARQTRDILYTPIYFANEKISAHIRFDKEWQSTYGEELDQQLNARARLIGKASLGFLSIGGRPLSGIDTRYAVPSLGFKAIYTLEILNLVKRVSLANIEYEADDGVRGGRVPFAFTLPSSTLDDLQQIASSLRVISADNTSTMTLLDGVNPALIVNVQYVLVAEVLDKDGAEKYTSKEEIRIFTSLSEEQVPTASDPAVVNNPMAKFVTTQVFSLGNTRSRRGSIALIRRLSRTSTQESSLMTIDVEGAEPFTFTRHSDAAASKVTISLIYTTDASNSSEAPPTVYGAIQWMLKSLTTLTLEPIDRGEDNQQRDDYFHLKTKVLPSRKLKLKWTDWERLPESNESQTRWKTKQDVWLIKDITAGMTPTFTTPYLAHTYLLNMQINLADNEAKLSRSFSSSRQKVELDVPVQLRYDLGLVPSYEIDSTLPEYDHTLPEYEEHDGGNRTENDVEVDADVDTDADAEDNQLPDLSGLDLGLVETRVPMDDDDDNIPARRLAHSHAQSSTDQV